MGSLRRMTFPILITKPLVEWTSMISHSMQNRLICTKQALVGFQIQPTSTGNLSSPQDYKFVSDQNKKKSLLYQSSPFSTSKPHLFQEKMSIDFEAPGIIQVFSDGSLKRFSSQVAPPSTDIYNGYKCKDVTLDPLKPITARIFFPNISDDQLLPVLIYFHGGGFCFGFTTWVGYHHFLGDLSVASKSIIVSVDYRLAPEHKLPIAYEDCYGSLIWLGKGKNSHQWLKRADLSRVFLSGDSAGGNIVHQVAVRAVKEKPANVTIRGILPIHPYFGSVKRTKLEMSEGCVGDVESDDILWRLSLPEGSNRNFYGCNFEKTEMSEEEWNRFPEVVVYVAELDFLKERELMFGEFLKQKGLRVKIVEAEGESHTHHVIRPDCEATQLLQKQMSDFLNAI